MGKGNDQRQMACAIRKIEAMSEKIKLNKDEVIVFMGSMNAMPMMYALELKKLGYEVIYFVDIKKSDILSRPENHFPDIDYPYPSWIIELVLPSQILLPLFSRLFAALYERRIRRVTKKTVGCFILNGLFTSLSPYLSGNSNKIALSHGSDLDVWAKTGDTEELVNGIENRSIFKYLPKKIKKNVINYIVKKQYIGYQRSNTVLYFPIGFNVAADRIIRQLTNLGVKYVPRYDISFEPTRGQSRDFKQASGKIQIFSGVRFLYRTFPDGDKGSSKGNDLIIEGIAKYFSVNPNIQVHFVEKGEDVQFAKELCRQHGLEQVVVWHKEMPFMDLLTLYRESDICFDQLGAHWIGAIGGYALWLGKPLIANAESAVRSGIWPVNNPVCSARTSEDVYEWLVRLEDPKFRRNVSENSKAFVEVYMCARRALNLLFDADSMMVEN